MNKPHETFLPPASQDQALREGHRVGVSRPHE
jgi:hypothetical protein